MYKIRETTMFYPLSILFQESGLEVDTGDEPPEGTIKMWKCEDEETGELLAAAVLQYKAQCYVLKDLAVAEGVRKSGLGKELLHIVENEAKSLGAKDIWACAKVPSYYKQYGWKEEAVEKPEITRCGSCSEYNVSCFPVIIKKLL